MEYLFYTKNASIYSAVVLFFCLQSCTMHSGSYALLLNVPVLPPFSIFPHPFMFKLSSPKFQPLSPTLTPTLIPIPTLLLISRPNFLLTPKPLFSPRVSPSPQNPGLILLSLPGTFIGNTSGSNTPILTIIATQSPNFAQFREPSPFDPLKLPSSHPLAIYITFILSPNPISANFSPQIAT